MSTIRKEDAIKNFLGNEEKENALDFIAFLDSNGIMLLGDILTNFKF